MLRYGAVIALAAVLALGSFGCIAKPTSAPAPIVSAYEPDAATPQSSMLGAFTSALATDAAGTTVTIGQALGSTSGVRVPEKQVVGLPERVLLDGAAQVSRERVGLAIRYSGDIEFYARPGLSEYEFTDFSDTSVGDMVFQDGRSSRTETVTVAGMTMHLARGGKFRTGTGASGVMPVAITWRDGATEYTILSYESTPQRLMAVAAAVYAGK